MIYDIIKLPVDAPAHFTYWPGAIVAPVFDKNRIYTAAVSNTHYSLAKTVAGLGISCSHTHYLLLCVRRRWIVINGIYYSFSLCSHKPQETDELCARSFTIAFCSSFSSTLNARFGTIQLHENAMLTLQCSARIIYCLSSKYVPYRHPQLGQRIKYFIGYKLLNGIDWQNANEAHRFSDAVLKRN